MKKICCENLKKKRFWRSFLNSWNHEFSKEKIWPVNRKFKIKLKFLKPECLNRSKEFVEMAGKQSLQFIYFSMLYRKQNSIEFHKNKIRANWTNHTYERKFFFYTDTLQQEEEIYVEKKMKSKITNLFFL
jgi:hypothetical protein